MRNRLLVSPAVVARKVRTRQELLLRLDKVEE